MPKRRLRMPLNKRLLWLLTKPPLAKFEDTEVEKQ